jgi:hypothetical protein
MATKKPLILFLLSIIRTVVFGGLFFFLLGKDDYMDAFVYSASPFHLMWSFLTGRIFLGMMLFYPLMDWLGLWRNKFVKITRILSIALLTYLIITLEYSGTLYYRGENIPNFIPAAGILIPLIFIILPPGNKTLRFPAWSAYVLLGIAIAVPNILSPPDLFPFQKSRTENLNNEAFYAFALQSALPDSTAANQLIAFYSANCKYCRFTAVKIDGFIKKNAVETDNVAVFFAGNIPDASDYFTMQNLNVPPHDTINPGMLFTITNRSVPAVIHLQYGKIVGTYRFRTFNDREIMHQWKKTVTD